MGLDGDLDAAAQIQKQTVSIGDRGSFESSRVQVQAVGPGDGNNAVVRGPRQPGHCQRVFFRLAVVSGNPGVYRIGCDRAVDGRVHRPAAVEVLGVYSI